MTLPPKTDVNLAEPSGVQAAPILRPAEEIEEVDVWWGSYSGWTMIPSMLVCIALTAFIAWFTWVTFRGGRGGLLQLTFLGMAGTVWLLQTLRWAYRTLSYNYRLTTRRLFRDRGFGTKRRDAVELTAICEVRVRSVFHEQLVGVGRVVIFFEGKARRPLVLAGVRDARSVAELIRTYSQKARSLSPTR